MQSNGGGDRGGKVGGWEKGRYRPTGESREYIQYMRCAFDRGTGDYAQNREQRRRGLGTKDEGNKLQGQEER